VPDDRRLLRQGPGHLLEVIGDLPDGLVREHFWMLVFCSCSVMVAMLGSSRCVQITELVKRTVPTSSQHEHASSLSGGTRRDELRSAFGRVVAVPIQARRGRALVDGRHRPAPPDCNLTRTQE